MCGGKGILDKFFWSAWWGGRGIFLYLWFDLKTTDYICFYFRRAVLDRRASDREVESGLMKEDCGLMKEDWVLASSLKIKDKMIDEDQCVNWIFVSDLEKEWKCKNGLGMGEIPIIVERSWVRLPCLYIQLGKMFRWGDSNCYFSFEASLSRLWRNLDWWAVEIRVKGCKFTFTIMLGRVGAFKTFWGAWVHLRGV